LASGTSSLYFSTDNGDTWTEATGLFGSVNDLAVIGPDVFAGTTAKGVFHSTDNGVNWATSNSGLPNSGVNVGVGSIVAIGTTLLASATNNSIQGPMYRSTNLGASWTLANTGLPSTYFQYDAMFSDGSIVYAGGATLYKTTNIGDNWTQADNGIPQYSGLSNVRASGSNVFVAATNYIYRSTDGGGNWTPLGSAGLPFMNMVSVEIAGSAIYAGTIANGVYKSTDNGVTWTQKVTGLKARDMNNLFIDGSTLYGNGNSIFKTTDDGSTWINVRGNLKDSSSQPTLVYANGPSLIERDYPADGLERSTDGGATWTSIGSGLGSFGSVGMIISTGAGLLAADSRIYRSTNNGDTWFQVDSSLGNLAGFSGFFKTGSAVYAYGLEVAKSTDDGATWAWADSGMPAYFGVGGFTAVGSTLFAGGGFPNKVYKSTDNGGYWTAVTNIPASGGTSQLLGLGNDLFACSPNNGIFISKTLGSTWTKISTGLPTPNYAYSLAIHNGMMLAGTSGNSVWKRPLSDVTAVEEVAGILPTRFLLEQNYPNPFNPITNLQFTIVNWQFVSLKVYDVLGQEVATLVNEELHPGTYQVSWDANEKSSGIYYYKLQTGMYSEMKKMVLIK
jgi:photosystem II stability/assembly factor-like uncharacterized protein